MRVEQLGTGTPAVAIVSGVHGDEPSGARAIERLLQEDPAVERPVKLIVANELALERGVRFVDADLNRAFGETTDETTHEYGVARQLARELSGCTALSLHATQSYDRPFAIVNQVGPPVDRICPQLSIAALVEVTDDEGRPFALEAADLIEVEAGRQGTDAAAENAYRIAREFLTATDVLPGPTVENEVAVFSLGDPIAKRAGVVYEVCVENFERVAVGERYATADGTPLVAEEAFYPILMSANGYEDVLGYAGDKVGRLPVSSAASTR